MVVHPAIWVWILSQAVGLVWLLGVMKNQVTALEKAVERLPRKEQVAALERAVDSLNAALSEVTLFRLALEERFSGQAERLAKIETKISTIEGNCIKYHS